MNDNNLNEKDIVRKSKNFDIKILFFLIILFIIVVSVLYIMPKYSDDSTFIAAIIVFVGMGLIGIYNNVFNDCSRTKTIKNILIQKYGSSNIVVNKKPKPKIVYGDKTKVGNLRNKYIFSFYLIPFNCCFSCYSREILIRRRGTKSHMPSYHYEKILYINEYSFNLGINVSENILKNEKIQNIIKDIKSKKNIEVSINSNTLIYEKETMKNTYTDSFAILDVEEIEYIYNVLIKPIKEEYYNGNET